MYKKKIDREYGKSKCQETLNILNEYFKDDIEIK